MLKLTEKQKQAVFTRDCDILVSAAAGSGKTAVLSERILQQLLDADRPASVTDFLIVTFTNAAAAEMKDRIGKKIMEAASDESLDSDMKAHLRRQLSLLAKANITTIHAFCLDIIRNNFHLLDIDPDIRVADKNETEILKLQVADEMLEEMYSKNGQLFSELCKWLGGGNDERFVDELLSIYRFLSGFPKPFDWLKEKIEEYNPEKVKNISEVSWIGQLQKLGRETINSLILQGKKILDVAEREGILPYQETFNEDILVLNNYLKCFEGGIKCLMKYVPDFSKIKLKPRDADAETCEMLREERNAIKEKAAEVSGYFAFTEAEFYAQLEKVYPRLLCLEESMVVFDRIFKEKKKNLSIIDFGDFEHFALEILEDSSNGVAHSLKERYREIMIDEYQDCNQTQELIFSYINRKVDGKSSNMFMVGDIKQSIYRFRLADPDIFAEKNRRYSDEGLQRKIVLNNNFRSSATILDGVNAVFEKIMSEALGGTDYSEEEKLYFRNDNPDKSTEEKCELVLVEKNPESDLSEPDYVAERILTLVSGGYKFSDIAILLRSAKSKSGDFEQALKARNIPYFSDGGNGYFESLEISILSSMLKVIDNPMQDIELVALMRSPVFEFDENLLANIRLEKRGPFYGALVKYAATNAEGAEKCQNFLNRLAVWRDKVLFMPVDEFIEYLLADSGLDVFAASLMGGEQRTANLKLFILQARLLQNSGFKGLFSFVNYMDRLSAGGENAEAKMLSENSNVVRIVTIHKSKGLEFPVVFLCGCDSAFNKRDVYKDIILHKNAGIGIRFLDAPRKIKYPLVSFKAVKHEIFKDNISEEMRVLYVALTRAKEKLICTATFKEPKKQLEKLASADNSPLELLYTSNYFEWIARAQHDENWKTEFIMPDSIGFTKLKEEKTEFDFSSAKGNLSVGKIFEYKYPFENASKLPSKISVSEVKKRREYESPFETRLFIPEITEKPAFLSDEKVSAAEKGIINHLVLRHIDLHNPDVAYCTETLKAKGLMSETDAQFIETDGIVAFFESEIGSRVKNAEKVYRELSFGMDINAGELFTAYRGDDSVMLQGIIDLLFVEDGGSVVVDYKTDSYLSPEKKEMYKTQLELYSKAAEIITGKPVKEKYLYMLKNKEVIEF